MASVVVEPAGVGAGTLRQRQTAAPAAVTATAPAARARVAVRRGTPRGSGGAGNVFDGSAGRAMLSSGPPGDPDPSAASTTTTGATNLKPRRGIVWMKRAWWASSPSTRRSAEMHWLRLFSSTTRPGQSSASSRSLSSSSPARSTK